MRLADAYAQCRAVARAEARNFYYGFVLLPPPRRDGIYAAYAFSRRADDSVDGDEPLPEKARAVDARRAELDAAYAGAPPSGDPVLVALADTVRRFAIPRRHFDDLLDGVQMDLGTRRYADEAALMAYCARVAGAVGLVSLHIFGFRDARAPAYADELGLGLQLVNIMRDVAEDATRDRIYLPLDSLARHGVTEGDILAGRFTPGFQALMAEHGARAHRLIDGGERLLPLLDRRARMCVSMLSGLYRAILGEIEARGYDVLDRRVSLSPARKLALMGRRTAASL